MTTELEKQFFQCFGIEPKYQDTCTVEEKYWQNEELANEFGTFDQYMNIKCGNQENCTTQCSCAYQKEIYPQITDYKLLQLLALCQNKSYEEFKSESFKKIIMIMGNNPYHKHQVQAIFKEERWSNY